MKKGSQDLVLQLTIVLIAVVLTFTIMIGLSMILIWAFDLPYNPYKMAVGIMVLAGLLSAFKNN